VSSSPRIESCKFEKPDVDDREHFYGDGQRSKTCSTKFPDLVIRCTDISPVAQENESDANNSLYPFSPMTNRADFKFQSSRPRIQPWISVSSSSHFHGQIDPDLISAISKEQICSLFSLDMIAEVPLLK